MLKKETKLIGLLFGFMFVVVLVSCGFVSAVGVSLSDTDATTAQISISSATNLYSYEVNLDYTGSIDSVAFDGFLSLVASDTTTGNKEKSSISSIYESRLDATKTGVTGSGDLFSVSHSGGTVTLNSVLFIYNDGTQEEIDYTDDGSGGNGGGSSGGSSGGGGGGGDVPSPIAGIDLDLEEFNLDLVLNSNKERLIKVTNNGKEKKEISLRHFNLEGVVMFREGDSFFLEPGESKEIKILFIASENTGIIAGKIFIGGQPLLVSVNTRTKELLFDATAVIPDYDKVIKVGETLDVQITLIPMGDDPRVDVTLNYIIKDFDGQTFFSESETILVEGQKNIKKEFFTSGLPAGDYVLGLEVVYPNGVATSSSHFSIGAEEGLLLNVKSNIMKLKFIFIVLGVVILIIILLIILSIKRYSKHKKRILKRVKK